MRKIYWLPVALLPALGLPTLGRAQTTPAAAAATGPVTGVVRQASDRTPLPGVNVIVKGTSNGTSTGADGRYTLTGVPAGATLVFSFVGYEPMERRADGGPLDITLVARQPRPRRGGGAGLRHQARPARPRDGRAGSDQQGYHRLAPDQHCQCVAGQSGGR